MKHLRLHACLFLLVASSSLSLSAFQAKVQTRKRVLARSQPPASAALADRVKAIVARSGGSGQWGVLCIDLESGKQLVALNADQRLAPASVAKLFTTAAALARLGPDFVYKTTSESSAQLSPDGTLRGDLILKGRGDPNLSARVLPYDGDTERADDPGRFVVELARKVAARGVKRVDGDLVVDDTYFVHQPYGDGWTVGDLTWGYGAPVSSMVVNDSVVVVKVNPGKRPGESAIVEQSPLPGYFTTTNRVKTLAGPTGRVLASTSAGKTRIGVNRPLGSKSLAVWGSISVGEPEFKRAVAQDDPSLYAGYLFRQKLEEAGVKVQGEIKLQRLNPDQVEDLENGTQDQLSARTAVLAAHDSMPLIDSLKVIEKVSQNLHAEMLLRTLGRERRGIGSVEAGLKEVGAFLSEIGVGEDQVELRDGSGLSRESLATPAAVIALLKHMYGSKFRASWIDLMPIAGVDGSLVNRLNNSELDGHLHAKTGSLSGVAALAGYILQDGKHPLAIAVMTNNGNGSHASATGMIDRIALEIARGR